MSDNNIKIVNKKNFRKNEILTTQANIFKISKSFDWKPTTDLKEGLKKILNEKFSN